MGDEKLQITKELWREWRENWWDFVGRAWGGERYYTRVVCCCCSAFVVQSMLCGTQWVTKRWVFEFEIVVKIFSQMSVRVSYEFDWVRVVRYWDMSLSEEIWVMSVGIWVNDKPNKALYTFQTRKFGIIISIVKNFINHTAQLDGLFKLTIRWKSDHKKFSILIIWKDKMKNWLLRVIVNFSY